jgi:hypothetical protein
MEVRGHRNALATLLMGKGSLVPTEEEARRAPRARVEGLEKKVSFPFWEMCHNSLNSVKCGYTEPVFCHRGTTAALSRTGVCHDSRGVLVFWTVMRESHCILVTVVMGLLQNTVDVGNSHNGVASNFCVSVTCSYSCMPILRFVPFSIRASSSLSLP